MKGRKPSISPELIINAVLHFKNWIITEIDGEKKIVVATNNVWTDISNYLDCAISKIAIHTLVFKARYGIKEKLGLCIKKVSTSDIPSNYCDFNESDSSFNNNTSDEEELPKIKIVNTFSPEEWEQIQPQQCIYNINDKTRQFLNTKSYCVLPKNAWTPILAEQFWAHTQLPCSISFRGAKVQPNGTDFVTVVGRCTSCESKFKGIVREKPLGNTRVLMRCLYTGNFNEHKSVKKRRIIGPAKEKALMPIIDGGIYLQH